MKRNIILLSCALVLAFAVGLTGFTLVQPDTSEKDKLIGIFVTKEYLDLFDFEGYLNNNAVKMTDAEITMAGDRTKYQGRLYATLMDRNITDQDTGETVTTQEYVFEGVEGFPFFYYTTSDESGTCTNTGNNQAISVGHTNISVTNEGEDISLEGTIYVAPTGGCVTCYLNPVYQSADGRIYAMSGDGISFEGNQSEGAVYSQTLTDTTTVTENRKTNNSSFSIKLSFSVMNPPQRIYVLQFGSDGVILSRDEYLPGSLPETISPERDCSYIVLETYKTSKDRGEFVTRSLYQEDNEILESFYYRKDGICVKQCTALKWTS